MLTFNYNIFIKLSYRTEITLVRWSSVVLSLFEFTLEGEISFFALQVTFLIS
jgi:hypothetical protein